MKVTSALLLLTALCVSHVNGSLSRTLAKNKNPLSALRKNVLKGQATARSACKSWACKGYACKLT